MKVLKMIIKQFCLDRIIHTLYAFLPLLFEISVKKAPYQKGIFGSKFPICVKKGIPGTIFVYKRHQKSIGVYRDKSHL